MKKQSTFNELITAHKELVLQHTELEKCNGKLVIANNKLFAGKKEKEKQVAELNIANSKLVVEDLLKDKQNERLQTANLKLKKAEDIHEKQKLDLNNMMHVISHKIRKSVANILGISNLLIENEELTPSEVNEMIQIIIQSAQSLNIFTAELSKSIHLKRGDNTI